MFSKYSKIVVALILAVVIALFSAISAFCADENTTETVESAEHEPLNDFVSVRNSEIYFYNYNVAVTNEYGAKFENENTEDIQLFANDCIKGSIRKPAKKGVVYKFYQISDYGEKGTQNYCFDNTGGIYQKIRVKLSLIDNFNDDGSRTAEGHNFYFSGAEVNEVGRYSSSLIFISGACVNFVAPDKDGYVEIYVPIKMNVSTRYYTHFRYYINATETSVNIGGYNGRYVDHFRKGDVNVENNVQISDATMIQRYLSNYEDFDEITKFRADVDCNDKVDIFDVTLIQKYIAKLG